ncbi:MAG: hypothetical protein ACYDC1_16375 [Limisphaerales bacterium]
MKPPRSSPKPRPPLPGRRLGKLFAALGLLVLPVCAHDFFSGFIQHRVQVTVGARHTDVIVELTFFEDTSAHEREHMDANADGQISKVEVDTYLTGLKPELAGQVRLRADGRDLELIPLHAPEADLLGHDQVGRAHHRLRLSYFTTTPAELKPGVELVVENRLWPGSRALVALEAQGKDGYQLEARPASDPARPPLHPGETRPFTVRCVNSPVPATPSKS